MTFLSDYQKLNDIYTFSKPKERKDKTLREAKAIGEMYDSIVTRYLEGIKGQIKSLVINSGGKDLNIGKIVQPALKVLWLEGLHEGLFYDRKQEFSFVSDNIEFAKDEASQLRLQKIETLKTLRNSTFTKEERQLLQVYDQLDKLQQLSLVGSNPTLNQALSKRQLRKSESKKLQKIDSKLKQLTSGNELLDYDNPNEVLQRFDDLKTTKEKLAYYDRLNQQNRKLVRSYVMESTPENSFRQIKDYDITGKKLTKTQKRQIPRGYTINDSGALSKEQIESKSRSAIKTTSNRTKQEIETILDNPELTRKEKRQALNRLISPTSNRSFPFRNREKIQQIIEKEQTSSQIRLPSAETKAKLASLLRTKNRPGSLGSTISTDIRERIRDIETYYPYIASTEERESDVQAYIEARSLELSNYYTENFKDNIKTQVAQITKDSKGDLTKTRIALKDLFTNIEGQKDPEREEKYNKLVNTFDRQFKSLTTKPTAKQLEREQLAYEQAQRRVRKKWLNLDQNKKPYREIARLKEIYNGYKKGDLDETNNNLIRKYIEQGKTKKEILAIISKAIKAKEKTLEGAFRDYLSDSDEASEARNILKQQRPRRNSIKVEDLDEKLKSQLVKEGVIREEQKFISSKGFTRIKQILRDRGREKDRYTGVNPIIAEQHKSLVEARKLSAIEARKINARPGDYTNQFYKEIHSEKLGRKLTSDDYPPDNINNLIVNPYKRLERILNNELATSYNLGRMEAFIRNGVSQVRWISVLDSNTSTFCTSLNNRIFNIAEIQAFSAGRGLVYDYFPNTKKTFDEVKRNSAIGVFYIPSVHPYCRSYLEPVPPQKEIESEKKNYFSPYQQALSEQLAARNISAESLVNNDRLLQAMVVMGAVALNVKSRADRKKKEEERKKLLVTGGTILVAGVGAYAIARSRVARELLERGKERLAKGKRIYPEPRLIKNFTEAVSQSLDDAVEQVTDARPPLMSSATKPVQPLPELRPKLKIPEGIDPKEWDNMDPLLQRVLSDNNYAPAVEATNALDNGIPISQVLPDISLPPKRETEILDLLNRGVAQGEVNPSLISQIEQEPTMIGKLGKYIEIKTGKKPPNRDGLELALLEDLITINDRTSKEIITTLVRSQARDAANLEANIDLLLSKSFKGRLPNTNDITSIQLVDAERRLYLVRQKRTKEPSLISSDLDPTVYSDYAKELAARKAQLVKNLRKAKTAKKQKELKALISDYEKAIDRLSRVFAKGGKPITKKQRQALEKQIASKFKLYEELNNLDLKITTKSGREVTVDATKVIGNAGQRARSFISLLNQLDNPQLRQSYIRFFFRDEQIKGLSLRYRGVIKEDISRFLLESNITNTDISTKIDELRALRTYIVKQISDKGNLVLRDYETFNLGLVENNIIRKPNVIAKEKKFFTDNVNLYIRDIRSDIDKQIKILEDLL